MLNIKTEIKDKVAEVVLDGRMDGAEAPKVDEAFNALPETIETVILDLEDLIYVSSAGLRVFLAAQKKMNARSGRMKFMNVGENVMEIFETTGFDRIFDISDN